jgi:hypothetical protein
MASAADYYKSTLGALEAERDRLRAENRALQDRVRDLERRADEVIRSAVPSVPVGALYGLDRQQNYTSWMPPTPQSIERSMMDAWTLMQSSLHRPSPPAALGWANVDIPAVQRYLGEVPRSPVGFDVRVSPGLPPNAAVLATPKKPLVGPEPIKDNRPAPDRFQLIELE